MAVDCPQPDYPIRERMYTPEQLAARAEAERVIAPQLAAFDAIFGVGAPFGDALTAAEARANKIHAALEASRDDD